MATALAPASGRGWREQLFALTLMALCIGQVCSQDLGTVYVTAQDYSSGHQAGNIQGLYCDTPTNHNPYACESDYWVAYSVSLNPPMSMSLCGKCLQECTLFTPFSVVARFKYQSQNWVHERSLLYRLPTELEQVTNNDGGASVKACILDQKQAAGLDLDQPGFTAIDTDGQGAFHGHLYCTVEFVNC